jgi:hypothetical protein
MKWNELSELLEELLALLLVQKRQGEEEEVFKHFTLTLTHTHTAVEIVGGGK